MRLIRINQCVQHLALLRLSPAAAAATSFRSLCDKPPKDEETKLTVNGENDAKDGKAAKALEKSRLAKERLDNLLKSVTLDNTPDDESETTISFKLAKPVKKQVPDPPSDSVPQMEHISTDLNKRLESAVDSLTEKVGGKEGKAIKADLEAVTQSINKTTVEGARRMIQPKSLKSVLKGMKVDAAGGDDESLKPGAPRVNANGVNMAAGFKMKPPLLPRRRSRDFGPLNVDSIFNGKDLGIFDANMESNPHEPKLETWKRLQNHELQLLVTHAPSNAFEEMIKWTEEGKLWQFPIDNERGLEEEAKVPFYEHVILDKHLEGFPQSGPVRDYMEVVVIGLSRNPYMTVDRKVAYIDWYREYFKSKNTALKAVGAI